MGEVGNGDRLGPLFCLFRCIESQTTGKAVGLDGLPVQRGFAVVRVCGL